MNPVVAIANDSAIGLPSKVEEVSTVAIPRRMEGLNSISSNACRAWASGIFCWAALSVWSNAAFGVRAFAIARNRDRQRRLQPVLLPVEVRPLELHHLEKTAGVRKLTLHHDRVPFGYG